MDHSAHIMPSMSDMPNNHMVKADVVTTAPPTTMDHSMHTTMDHSMHSTMDHSMMDMDGMKMYFHFGVDEVILFDFWRTDEVWELIVSMLVLYIIAFSYEGLKYSREFLFRKAIGSSQYTSSDRSNVAIADNNKPVSVKMLSSAHVVQTLLHTLQFLVSYCLMLVFMTYNVWLCLACLLGSGTGYFFFGWRKSVVVDITEHCH